MAVEINDDAKKIIKTYSLIYTIIFVLWIPIAAFATSMWIFISLQTKVSEEVVVVDNSATIDKTVENKLKEFEKFNSSSAWWSWTNVDVKVYDGPFTTENDFLISQNNILIYKWLVLPNYISHKLPLPTQEKKYFSKIWYSLNELSSYVDKVVLTKIDTKKIPQYERPILLKIPNDDLVSFFSLKCLASNKMISKICDEYTKYFLDVMFVYDLSKDSDWLKSVSDKIVSNQAFNQQFCEGIHQYLKNSNYADNSLANIVLSCGEEVDNLYTALKDLNIIKKDLLDVTSKYVSDDRELNAYKLISLQQLIYNEVEKRRLNQPRVAAYLQFIKELLKKDTLLEHIYFDEAFLFNNTYLTNVLKLPTFNMSAGQKEVTKILQQTIREMNIGSELEWYKWLYSRVQNKNLEALLDEDDMDWEMEKAEIVTLRDRFNEKFSFNDLDIKDVKQRDDNIFVKWVLKLKVWEEKKKKRFLVNLVFSDYRWSFAVDYISFADKWTLNDVLNTILEKNKLTMSQLYDYMLKNADLFLEDQEEVTFCDILSWNIDWVQNCSNSQVWVEVKSWSMIINYTFLHKDWIIKDILVTNKSLQAKVQVHFSWYETNSLNFGDFIAEVIEYKPEVEKEEVMNDITQTERTIIDGDFEKYLEANVAWIIKQNWDILVAFDINKIEFIALYDVDIHTIKTLFFKKLWTKEKFSSFDMELSTNNGDDIEFFVTDPLDHLQALNPRIVDLYKNNKKR